MVNTTRLEMIELTDNSDAGVCELAANSLADTICLLMHPIHSGRSPTRMYLADIVEPASNRSTRRLPSTERGLYDVPRPRTKFGEKAFSFSGPSAWNAVPTDI